MSDTDTNGRQGHDLELSRIERWVLRAVPFVGAAYPPLVLTSGYGEWLLAWCLLGHPPRISYDDPKGIAGSNVLHLVTFMVMQMRVPVASLTLALLPSALRRTALGRGQQALVGVAMLIIWFGVFLFLRWDPGRVWEWWWD